MDNIDYKICGCLYHLGGDEKIEEYLKSENIKETENIKEKIKNCAKQPFKDLRECVRDSLETSSFDCEYKLKIINKLNKARGLVKTNILKNIFKGSAAKEFKDFIKNQEKDFFVLAAGDGDLLTVNKFIEEGIDINHKDQFGDTALIKAVKQDKFFVVEFLLKQRKISKKSIKSAIKIANKGEIINILKNYA